MLKLYIKRGARPVEEKDPRSYEDFSLVVPTAESSWSTADGVAAETAARHFAEESDLVLAPDGVSGNLIFRTLHFVGGHEAYGAPVVNIPRVFVDTSRAKADFSAAVLLAAGLVHKGVRPAGRA